MPVVLVTAPRLASTGAEQQALSAINAAVAEGLGLRPEDVYSTYTPAGAAALGDEPVTAWPVVLIHGSPRTRERMDAAMVLVRNEICDRWRCDETTTWVQWVNPA